MGTCAGSPCVFDGVARRFLVDCAGLSEPAGAGVGGDGAGLLHEGFRIFVILNHTPAKRALPVALSLSGSELS